MIQSSSKNQNAEKLVKKETKMLADPLKMKFVQLMIRETTISLLVLDLPLFFSAIQQIVFEQENP
jgi:hypothetical protein